MSCTLLLILFISLMPLANASSLRCPQLQVKGQFLLNKILSNVEHLETIENIPHYCFTQFRLPTITFDKSPTEAVPIMAIKVFNETTDFYAENCKRLGLTRELCWELCQLLQQLIEESAPCMTYTVAYKDETKHISRHYRQFKKLAQKRDKIYCVRKFIWSVNEFTVGYSSLISHAKTASHELNILTDLLG
ncbi:hypothetical protein XELAEV_18000784mg [Xenopus laevis]|uniref:Type I interferon 9 n=1 Tax=Xenopus laevis TaxID=8355 RepID=A0A1B1FFT7_XENLA|nr:interferon-like LOC124416889 precursor [Xenopus laevis]ANQ43321.1 type I interferon 9 [Xenopus laevis]OCT59363.1 hypothetical protein XELAEV_18000784mg [Xenopus laevis]